MNLLSSIPSNFRLNVPESIVLEPENYQLAHKISLPAENELNQWEFYLTALASLGFLQWVNEQQLIDKDSITSDLIQFEIGGDTRICTIQLNAFKICLITLEHCLEDAIQLPQVIISEIPAHFYGIVEVAEEHQEVTFKGLLRHDQLINYLQQSKVLSNINFQVPFSIFDLEPHHLVYYYRYLDSTSIPLSTGMESVSKQISRTLYPNQESLLINQDGVTRNKLSQWFEGKVTGEWQSIQALVNEAKQLEASMRYAQPIASRAKIINLGIQLGEKPFVLLISVSSDKLKLQVLVQLHPSSWQDYLPSNLKLQLFSKNGRLLQEVKSRSRDNFIQLRSFQGEIGKCFKLSSSLDNITFLEEFEL